MSVRLSLQAMYILRKQQHELEAELEHQRERLHFERQHMQAAQEEQHKGLANQQVPAQGANWEPACSCQFCRTVFMGA